MPALTSGAGFRHAYPSRLIAVPGGSFADGRVRRNDAEGTALLCPADYSVLPAESECRHFDSTHREKLLVDSHIRLGHLRCREARLELASDPLAAHDASTVHRAHRLIHRFDDDAGDAVVHHFRNRAGAPGDDRRARRHRLDHDEAERLRPVDGEEERERIAEEARLGVIVDLADELDQRIGEQRLDDRPEVVLVRFVDLRSDLERHSARLAISIALSGRFSGEILPMKAR